MSVHRKNKQSWRAEIWIQGKRVASKTLSRKVDAEKWYQTEISKWHKEEITEVDLTPILFSELANLWMERHSKIKKAFSAYQKDEELLRLYLIPAFGKYRINDITPETIDIYIENQVKEERLKAVSINKHLALLKAIFNKGIKWRRVRFNPVTAVDMLPVAEEPFDYWQKDEVEKFLNYTNDFEHHIIYLFALNTGMRIGEIQGLLWKDVDFEKRMITVRRMWDEHGRCFKETTKSKRIRHLGINDSLYKSLMDHYQKRNSEHELVFCTGAGIQIDRKNFQNRHFYKDMANSSLRKIRFHDLRHTFASHFMMNGCGTIFDLKEILGHSDIRVTMRYAHLAPDHIREKMNGVSFCSTKQSEEASDFDNVIAVNFCGSKKPHHAQFTPSGVI